jgi:hypothetical protein
MKVHKKSKSTKPKPKERLKPEVAFFWVYAWLESSKSKFAERKEVTGTRLHIRPASLTDRIKAVVAAGKMFLDKRSVGRDANGYERVRVYTVVQPPDSLIRAARNWWEYEEAFGVQSPQRKSVAADTRVNSGDEPQRNSVLITADSSNHQLSAVNESESVNKFLQHDIQHISTTEVQGERKSVAAQVTTNQQVEPERNSVAAPEPDFYQHGATIPAEGFDQRKVPFCLNCEERVDYTRYPGNRYEPACIELNRFCDEDCEAACALEERHERDEAYAKNIAAAKAAGRNVL